MTGALRKNAGIDFKPFNRIRDTLLLLKFQLFHAGKRAVDLFPSLSVNGLLLPSEREVNWKGRSCAPREVTE